MFSFKIIFEGQTFIAEVNENYEIKITNEIILPVNAQMFFHLKESLIRNIKNGNYDLGIKTAIDEKLELIIV